MYTGSYDQESITLKKELDRKRIEDEKCEVILYQADYEISTSKDILETRVVKFIHDNGEIYHGILCGIEADEKAPNKLDVISNPLSTTQFFASGTFWCAETEVPEEREQTPVETWLINLDEHGNPDLNSQVMLNEDALKQWAEEYVEKDKELRKISQEEFEKIYEDHQKWLKGEENGKRADLSYCDLTNIKFNFKNISRSPIFVNLEKANLKGANLSGANLLKANFREANLVEADLSNAYLSTSILTRANLERANLENVGLIFSKMAGIDLTDCNLKNAHLNDSDLQGSTLINANLKKADLCGVNFKKANLNSANLFGANLSRANFSNANLYLANLQNTNLEGTYFKDSSLIHTDFRGANLNVVDFSNTSLATIITDNSSKKQLFLNAFNELCNKFQVSPEEVVKAIYDDIKKQKNNPQR